MSTQHISVTTVSDPEITRTYKALVPKKEERKENLDNLPSLCSYSGCSAATRRAQLKTCSRCKTARYCSPECQKSDWVAHKQDCGPPHRDLALKLAERSMAVPRIVELLRFIAIIKLDLVKDRTNASKFFLKVTCDAPVADLAAYWQRTLSGVEKDPNPRLALGFSVIEKISRDDAPENVRAYDSKIRGQDDGDLPLVTWYFVNETDSESGSDRVTIVDTGLCHAKSIPVWQMQRVAEGLTTKIRSAILGDCEERLIGAEDLREEINNFISMDKQNKMRLRGFKTQVAT
ncbi:hypothetical protein C8J56DRAFT_518572 [Mycena floridula]|nr:hypothetical protein C8J56DRAFT_518572 [Mycena floridula]